jgi:hypothetical protein
MLSYTDCNKPKHRSHGPEICGQRFVHLIYNQGYDLGLYAYFADIMCVHRNYTHWVYLLAFNLKSLIMHSSSYLRL